jgi:hypothetical protein
MDVHITGDYVLDKKLTVLGDDKKAMRSIGRRATRRGLAVLANAQKQAVPPPKVRKTNQRIKQAIGQRFVKDNRRGRLSAKAGVHVGMKKRPKQKQDIVIEKASPAAHWTSTGTDLRFGNRKLMLRNSALKQGVVSRKGAKRLYRGRVQPNDYIGRAASSVDDLIPFVMADSVEQDLIAHFKSPP